MNIVEFTAAVHEANEYARMTTPHCPICDGLLDVENYCIDPDCPHYNVPAVIIDGGVSLLESGVKNES